MKYIREIIAWSVLCLTPIYQQQVQDTTKKELIENIQDKEDLLKDNNDTIRFNPNIKTEKVDELKYWPLFMSGTNRHIWEFLGYNQYEQIFENYNGCYFDENDWKKEKSVNNFSEINFPLIYDWLDTIIPDNVWELLNQDFLQEYKETLKNHQDIIIIKNIWEKFALRYYKNWKLYLATHVSIWRWNMTPKWLFQTGFKIAKHKSSKYNDAAMPYAIHLKWNYFIHQGKVTGQKLSHGCIRVPWLYQKEIYESTAKGTPVIIDY